MKTDEVDFLGNSNVTSGSVPRAMTIAGSDSGGGAGIQADLKTFAALRVYGTSIITAVTAQNTLKVTEVMDIPIETVKSQIDTVLTDIGTDVVKTGMLSSSRIIEVVVSKVKEYSLTNLVVDPVMVAKSGAQLLREEAVEALVELLIPISTVVTPNIQEAEVLTGKKILSVDDARDAARQIVDMGAHAAVVKGGHLDGPATDIFFDGTEFRAFTAPRITTTSTHGTGCTLASAIAAGIAKGLSVRDSVSEAKKYVTAAIRSSFPVGKGHGPLNHFHTFWQ